MRFGTRFVWVVRMSGPRRVEVHEPGKAMRVVGPDDVLAAPGVLKNPVPVLALYDRDTAHAHTFKNLLQRYGYQDLEAVKDAGRLVEARAALRRVLARRKLALSPEDDARIDAGADLASRALAQSSRRRRERRGRAALRAQSATWAPGPDPPGLRGDGARRQPGVGLPHGLPVRAEEQQRACDPEQHEGPEGPVGHVISTGENGRSRVTSSRLAETLRT